MTIQQYQTPVIFFQIFPSLDPVFWNKLCSNILRFLCNIHLPLFCFFPFFFHCRYVAAKLDNDYLEAFQVGFFTNVLFHCESLLVEVFFFYNIQSSFTIKWSVSSLFKIIVQQRETWFTLIGVGPNTFIYFIFYIHDIIIHSVRSKFNSTISLIFGSLEAGNLRIKNLSKRIKLFSSESW